MEAGMVESEWGPYVEYKDVERLLKAAEKLLLMDAQYEDLGYERKGKDWERAMADLWRETFPANVERR